jgi:hypothetical protein
MGWASGGGIFDNVADALLRDGADDDLIKSVLTDLSDYLEESRERYQDFPMILQALEDED